MKANQDLSAKLDTLIRLTAFQLLGERTGADAIVLLGRAGLDTDVISDIVGASPATVRSALSRARRRGGRRRSEPRASQASTSVGS